MSQHNTSEGVSFSQMGGASNKQLPPYDKTIGKIYNTSDTYRKVTQHHIVQNKLPILRVIKKVMTKNINLVNQVDPPRLARQKL